MGFSVSQPLYIYQSSSGYIFRLRVPGDLRELVGRSEFRYSLRAGALRIAKQRARSIAAYIQQLFLEVRSRMAEFTKEQILQLVKRYVQNTLENDERCRALSEAALDGESSMEGQTLLGRHSLLEGSNMKAEEADSLLKSVNRWLKNQDHSLMEPVAQRLANSEGLDITPNSTLHRELLKAFQSILKVRIKRAEGDYSEPDEDLVPILKQQQIPPYLHPMTSGSGVDSTGSDSWKSSDSYQNSDNVVFRFSELQDRYLEEIAKAESWTEKTLAENLSIFELFTRVVGDIDVSKIDRKVLSEFKSTLMKLPPNINKSPKYAGKSLQEILASKPAKTLSTNSVNKYLRRVSGIFNFAVRNGYMPSNPAEGIQIKRQKRADQEREAYTAEDLMKIFHSEEYTEGKHRSSYAYWTPYIALYSGCRLEEICQLHLEDIRQENEVWVFDINDKEEKRVKTHSSARLVPLHPHLIKLGLLDHVDDLKAKGETRLFPELRQRRDGYGQTVSKWFQRYKKSCGIAQGKTFHSFRHTFITHLKHKQVDPFMIHELDGHTIESETMGRYGKRYTPEILLREAIEKIDYGLT